MLSETAKRRSRYKRAVNDPVDGRFQVEGDTEIITLVHDYRYLTRPLLELLTARRGTSLKRRLRFLYDHHYLAKVHFSRAYRETGSMADIYVLDEPGREQYQRSTGEKADASPLRNQNKDPQLEHTLLINTVRAMITAACAARDDVALVEWHRESKQTRDTVLFDDGTARTVAPDAFFILRCGEKVMPFFLEADRSTMDLNDMVRKYAIYNAYYETIRADLDRRKKHPDHQLANRFGIPGFRVLTVVEQDSEWQQTRNRDRLSSLIDSGLRAVKNGAGWKALWFTMKARLDLAQPETILAPVWHVAYQGETEPLRSIIE